MESNSKTQIRVGLFLALGLLAGLVSILALGGQKSLFRSYVRIHSHLTQVQGLAEGSVVSLSGVTIGNIESIRFGAEAGSLDVTMKIDQDFQTQIPKDSTVEIRTQGALGDKFIYINPGDLAKGTVSEGSILEADKSLDLMSLLSQRGGEAGKVFDIFSEVHKLMKTINDGNRSEKMMQNFAEASTNMKEAANEARGLMTELRSQNSKSLNDSVQKLNSILTKIDKGEGSLGALINDPSLHEKLKALLGGSPRKQYFQSILQNSIEKKDK